MARSNSQSRWCNNSGCARKSRSSRRGKPCGRRDRFVSCRNVLTMVHVHAGEIGRAAYFWRKPYPRPRRLYPHPPPPSKITTKRTINKLSIPHLSFLLSGSWWTSPSKSPLASPSLSILGAAEAGVCVITDGCVYNNAQSLSALISRSAVCFVRESPGCFASAG
jgi:hypothetical protein